MATPWLSAYKHLRPVRAKVWANGWLLLLPLQGVGNGDMVPRALPWATDLLGFQPAQGRRQGFFRTISTYLIFLDFEHPTLRGRCANMQRRFEAKHCSSLCSQSEGGKYYGGQARAENPRKSCPRIFATCSWPSLCEQSELQCYRPRFSLHHALQVIDSRPKVALLAAEGKATRGRR